MPADQSLPILPFGASRVKKFHVGLWVSALFVTFSLLNTDFFTIPMNLLEDANVKTKNATYPVDAITPSRSPTARIPTTPSPTITPTSATRTPTSEEVVSEPVMGSTPRPVATVSPDSTNPISSKSSTSNSTKNRPVATFPPQAAASNSSFTIQTPDFPDTNLPFVDEHCDLSNLPDWYPDKDNQWQQRAPYVMIAGVWNGGIANIGQALQLHPQITATPKNGFFLPNNFRKFSSRKKVQVFAARQRMYAQVYPNQKSLKETPTKIVMDVSPGYLFYANTAYSILCTAPWSKLVVVLRNPVDRVYRQWVYASVHKQLRLSLREWIAQELKLIQKVKLFEAKEEEEEQEAWEKYQFERGMSGVIGRSIYILQIQEWIRILKEAGKDPAKELYVVPVEVWEDEPHLEYSKLVQWLGLEEHHPKMTKYLATFSSNTTNKMPPMEKETREMLQNIFAPYNRRLLELLSKENMFGDYWNDKNLWSH